MTKRSIRMSLSVTAVALLLSSTVNADNVLDVYVDSITDWDVFDCCGGSSIAEVDLGGNNVLEFTFDADPGTNTVTFFQPPAPVDLSGFAGGTVEFDMFVVSQPTNPAPNPWLIKVDCDSGCSTGDRPITQSVEGVLPATGVWQHYTFNLDDLVAEGLDLSRVSALVIFPAWGNQDNAVFQLDNVQWKNDDGDGDGDGVPDDVDNCPADPNPLQENFDGDTEGDVCDLDDDNDGQTDSDETACGSDPMNAATLSSDNDTDNLPDCVDPDDDNDGVDDGDDAFPFDPTETEDNDGDGTGDNADADDDNDGQTDSDETACGSDPLNASSTAPDADNDDVPDCVDTDDDNDGVSDGDDVCPDTNEEAPTSNRGLNKNRWALLNGNNFVQAPPQAGSVFSFTVADTRGCSCSQIVDAAGVGNNHLKRGCSTSVMLNWINNP